MARILGRHAFSGEYMPEVATTIIAENLRPAAIGVALLAHRSPNLVIEAGPATTGRKLAARVIELGIALFADKGSLGMKVVKLS